jgi:type I site-specific restriction endonuclease
MLEAVTTESPSLRELLTKFVDDVYETSDEVELGVLVAIARKHFARNKEFMDALVREAFWHFTREISHEVRGRRRDPNALGQLEISERLDRVFAHVGDSRHRKILQMTRPEHRFAAAERESQAAMQLRWAGYHRAIADLHRDDKCTTADCVSLEQLDSLWQRYFDEPK